MGQSTCFEYLRYDIHRIQRRSPLHQNMALSTAAVALTVRMRSVARSPLPMSMGTFIFSWCSTGASSCHVSFRSTGSMQVLGSTEFPWASSTTSAIIPPPSLEPPGVVTKLGSPSKISDHRESRKASAANMGLVTICLQRDPHVRANVRREVDGSRVVDLHAVPCCCFNHHHRHQHQHRAMRYKQDASHPSSYRMSHNVLFSNKRFVCALDR